MIYLHFFLLIIKLTKQKIYDCLEQLYYAGVSFMRTFKWKLFERKGKSKEAGKDEKLLQQNLDDLKDEALNKDKRNLKEVAKEVLKEE